MQMSIVSGRDEDPLSTHPALFAVVGLGVLVLLAGMVGRVTWHERAYVPAGTVSGFALLEKKGENCVSKNAVAKFAFPVAYAQTNEEDVSETERSLEGEVRSLVSGYPIEAMAPFIAKQERTVAAFLVGIAKKESDWGRHVPTKNGQDCYNYWGYKGAGSLGSSMGYGCFSSPEEAISVVGTRMHTLVVEKKNDSPSDMVIWKCGSRSCAGHEPTAVVKWIHDVDTYYSKLVAMAR